ncbi:hypothetical protein DUNSADRAFT_10800 [Dunaliella salina]|uniref:Uncharacterized protein n=1 Tax=Dunaliella salina TaxID=3046 RepID=A0ABQ7H9U5_DUNSA|nr:hypothetical protein DUNSADRAFT_10800 [Dunaliella salina]|eukprot:KAF5843626.1 hypothetical protein DUNSADRAFT_10800 [Dunaliella salina]
MDEVLMNEFGDVVNRLVVTRQGSPTRPLDLARVSASRASTVIWMPPEVREDESKVDVNTSLSATLASLHSLRRQGSPPQRVMVCEDAAGKLEGWNEAPSGRLISDHLLERGSQITSLADLSNLAEIMAQVGLQPGLSAVFEEVCQHSCGHYEFYSQINPCQRNITFRQARKGFPKAVLVGLVDVETVKSCTAPQQQSRHKRSSSSIPLPFTKPYTLRATAVFMQAEAASLAEAEQAQEAEAASLAAAEQAQQEQQLVAEAAPFKARKGGKPTTPEQRQEELHKPEKVVVLGFGGNVKRLADSLGDFCPPGSKVTLAIPEDPSCDDDYKALRADYDGLKINDARFRVLRGNMSSNEFLRKAGVPEADSVILGAVNPSDGWEPADADALVVATTLQLHSLLEDEASRYLAAQASTESKNGKTKSLGSGKVLKGNRPLSVVSCVAEERTKDVLNNIVAPRAAWQGNPISTSLATTKGSSRGVALQVIMTQELMSGMLTQVASDPMLLGLFDDLLDEEGSEMYMRAPEVYGVPVNVTKTWDEVQDAVRLFNTVCIGYLDQFGKVHLGANSGTDITLLPTEKLVVIAEK